jgi:uridine kinase
MSRESVLEELARQQSERDLGHPLRIGIDGICGVGKTTFALDLARHIGRSGRPVVRLDSDGFHHVRAIRYRQGRNSARGYYEDAYDFESLRELVLRPLGPGGTRRYASRVHDLESDRPVRDWAVAAVDAVLIFDATFLQRGDLREHWDEVIYLHASKGSALARGITRDADALGGREAATSAYASRYMAACDFYLDEERPIDRASIVVDHDDPAAPVVLRTGGASITR